MCGIFGFINDDAMTKFGDLSRLMLEQGLWHSAQRGIDGTGVLAINGFDEYRQTMYKNASWAGEYLASNVYRRMMQQRLNSARVAIGHTRATTRGAITPDNAHPFSHKHITLVHNGYIANANTHLPKELEHDVDSFAAAYLIAEKGAKAALEEIRFGGVFVWWDQNEGTLNIARNEHRELWGVAIKGQNAVFYASEWQMLHWVLARNGVEPGSTYNIFAPHFIYTFNPRKPKEWTKVPFARPPALNQSSGQHGANNHQGTGTGNSRRMGGGGLNAEDRNTPGSTSPTTNTSSESGDVYNVSGGDEPAKSKRPDQYTEAEMAHYERMFAHLDKKQKDKYGIPKDRTKLRKVCARIENTGIRGAGFGNRFIVYPDAWAPYKNQKDCGCILGSRRADADIKVELPNTSGKDYERLKADTWTYATVVNAKKRASGGWTLVMALIPDAPKSTSDVHTTQYEQVAIRGPGGGVMSLSDFVRKVQHGCSYCQSWINPNKPHEVLWFGDEPICYFCGNNPEIATELGLNTAKKGA